MTNVTISRDENGILNAEQVFNFFMSQVEPDLMTTTAGTLAEKYKDETPAEKTARGKRYKEAFAKWKTFFEAFMSQLKQSTSEERRSELRRLEDESRKLDEQEMERMESLFDEF